MLERWAVEAVVVDSWAFSVVGELDVALAYPFLFTRLISSNGVIFLALAHTIFASYATNSWKILGSLVLP